jgi:hypothetical protein
MDLLTILVAFGAIVGGFLLKLIGSEIQDWLPFVSRWLIDYATARLPPDERARRLEEWLADNNDYPGRATKMLHAVGCLMASYRMTRLGTKHPDHVSTTPVQQSIAQPKYRVIVWVADDLDSLRRKTVIAKEVQHCFSVLNELKIPDVDRIVEVRIIDKSNPLVAGFGAFSNIWSTSIDI